MVLPFPEDTKHVLTLSTLFVMFLLLEISHHRKPSITLRLVIIYLLVSSVKSKLSYFGLKLKLTWVSEHKMTRRQWYQISVHTISKIIKWVLVYQYWKKKGGGVVSLTALLFQNVKDNSERGSMDGYRNFFALVYNICKYMNLKKTNKMC